MGVDVDENGEDCLDWRGIIFFKFFLKKQNKKRDLFMNGFYLI